MHRSTLATRAHTRLNVDNKTAYYSMMRAAEPENRIYASSVLLLLLLFSDEQFSS